MNPLGFSTTLLLFGCAERKLEFSDKVNGYYETIKYTL